MKTFTGCRRPPVAAGVSIAAARQRLLGMVHVHLGMCRGLAGNMMDVADFAAKIELGHFIHHFASATMELRARLVELGQPEATLPDARTVAPLVSAVRAAGDAASAAPIVAAAAHALVDAHAAYRAMGGELVDQPTRRLLRRIELDLDDMRTWATSTHRRLGAGRLRGHSVYLRLTAAIGEVLTATPSPAPLRRRSPGGIATPPPRGVDGPPPRGQIPARDSRLTTFEHTRRYDGGDLDWPSGPPADAFTKELVEMARVQRDELDAIETFCNVLYDMEDAPMALVYTLARFIWDEARHAEAGQALLAAAGLPPFEVPCGVLGIRVRASLPPLIAFAQIHAFGETQQLAGLRRFAARARDAARPEVAGAFEFIHADELRHVREGRQWLQRLSGQSGTNYSALQEEARVQAVARLHAVGVLGEDYTSELTAADLAHMMGE